MYIIKKKVFFLLSSILLLALSSCGEKYSESDATSHRKIKRFTRPYFCRGSWHYPQPHYHYKEQGIASWYGPGFHGKQKATGEKYDQHALTAAHKTLPIPCVARVENLENGKNVIVTIEDRGPFVYKGRIIDLSIAAAKKISCYGKGTALVEVTVLPKQSEYFAKRICAQTKGVPKRTWREIYDEDVAPLFEGHRDEPLCPELVNAPVLTVSSKNTYHLRKKTPSSSQESSMEHLEEEIRRLDHQKLPSKQTIDHHLNDVLSKGRSSPNLKRSLVPNGQVIKIGDYFISKERAEEQLQSFGVKGCVIKDVHPASGQLFYTCVLGPFSSNEIIRIKNKLLKKGQKRFVVIRA